MIHFLCSHVVSHIPSVSVRHGGVMGRETSWSISAGSWFGFPRSVFYCLPSQLLWFGGRGKGLGSEGVHAQARLWLFPRLAGTYVFTRVYVGLSLRDT